MTEASDAPPPYRVVYSQKVRDSLRELIAEARESGRSAEVLAAVKEIDHRLQVYPQFGEPLLDLTQEPGRVWIGTVQPLFVRYAIYEARRLVVVVVPILPLAGSGL